MRGLRDAIAKLASDRAAERRVAASWLYIEGCRLADSATRVLCEDAEFAPLLRGKSTVGVAVHPQTFENIRKANGEPRLADVPPDLDAQEFELHLGNASLDIITTRAPEEDGAIAKFLKKSGEGIQQVEYFVRDVNRATHILRRRFGVEMIYPRTRNGADGSRVNFFLAATPVGKKVLIELVETASRDKE
jgi:methylmalonyl-CoA/ethylmalonyl-CoA epimerase